MKKFASVVVLLVVVCLSFSFAFAEVREMPPLDGKKVETLVLLRADWVKPHEGESQERYWTTMYWQFKELGLGFDAVSTPKTDFLSVNPYLTYKVGASPVQLVGGILTDSTGADFGHVGIWYTDEIRKAQVFLEIRNYIAVNGIAREYLDNLFEVVYPVSKKIDLGVSAVYDRFWTGEDRNYFQVGPIGYYKVNDAASVFVRPTRETGNTNSVRIGAKFVF